MELKGGTITCANYQAHLIEAFKKDCEDFLQEFEKLRSFNYSDFAQLWGKFNLSYIFAGHNYAAILGEFCENMFFTIKKYLVFQESIYIKVGAFYLLYGIYYKQPLKGWVKIRLTLSDFENVCKLMEVMRSQGLFDVLYCYAKMKIDQAFLFVCLPKKLGPEDNFLKFHQNFEDDTFKVRNHETSLDKLKDIMANSTFQELVKTNEEYEKAMRKFADKNPCVTVFSSSVISDFHAVYQKVYCDSSTEHVQQDMLEEVPGHSKQRVVEKAMANKNATYRGMRKVITKFDSDLSGNHAQTNSKKISVRDTRVRRKKK